MFLRDRIRRQSAELAAGGLLRTLRRPSGIDLCSNDYLCLAEHPALKQRMAEAVMMEGCGSTGSRLLRGERAGLSAIERRFAQFKGTDAAVYFATGYMANIAVLSTFLETDDAVYSDSLNHASLIEGMRLGRARRRIFPHSDIGALQAAMASEACAGQRFVAIDSVFSMDGDLAPLKEHAALIRKSGAALIVDEAHAVGIYGERGSGRIEEQGIARDVFVSINPMGKAFGCAGAFVCGPGWAIDYLIQRARPFIFSTAPPPAIAAAIDAALDQVEQGRELRERVLHLARFLRGLLADKGLDVARDGSPIIPVIIGGNAEALAVASFLQNAGFDVRAIRPPTVPPRTARLRISVNAGLTEEILRRFAALLEQAVTSAAA